MTRLFDGKDVVADGKRHFLESFSDYDDASYCSKRQRGDEDDEWSLDMHRAFVNVIFNTGLHICSPAVILENMTLKSDQVNSERVKSHLQKFRMKPDKAKEEFLATYDLAMIRLHKALDEFSISQRKRPDVEQIAKATLGSGVGCLLHAEPAAFLTVSSIYSDLEDVSMEDEYPLSVANQFKMNPSEFLDRYSSIELPTLTDDEKKTPLGTLFCYIMGTFLTLKQHILENRTRERFDNPGEICKHDMKYPSVTSFPSSSEFSSHPNLFKPTTQRPAPSPMDMLETVKSTYYVYEPPLSSLKRPPENSNEWNDSVADGLSASSHGNSGLLELPPFEKIDSLKNSFDIPDVFMYQGGALSLQHNSRKLKTHSGHGQRPRNGHIFNGVDHTTFVNTQSNFHESKHIHNFPQMDASEPLRRGKIKPDISQSM